MAECEGFICPLCMRDFRGVIQLEQHFQEDHAETTQSRFRSIKNFFGKLKKKNQDGLVDEGAAAASNREGGAEGGVVTNVSGIDPDVWEPQEFGYSCDLMGEFRRVRDVRIAETATETNRLIIRVERLFKVVQDTSPRTPKARKELERSVVTWRPDKEEKRCRTCGRGFNLRRRKHHCRLCGDIICKQCSQFMTLSETYPVLCDSPNYRSLAPPLKRSVLSLKRGKGRRERERERGAAQSEEEEDDSSELRMCCTCQKLIHRRLRQLQTLEKPLLSALYEKMQLTIGEADSMKPTFLLMADSIIAGDHGYRLHDAVKIRQDLIKLYELVDSISKDVLSLGGAVNDPASSSQRMFKLCRGIRVFASTYLQDNLLSLPSLPTRQQLAEIRERREREARERLQEIERQRQLQRQEELSRGPAHAVVGATPTDDTSEEEERGAIEASFSADPAQAEKKKRFEKLKNFSNKVIPKVHFKRETPAPGGGGGGGGGGESSVRVRGHSTSGWMSSSQAWGSVDSQEDPFTLQQQQLVGFIEQARAAGRMEEVAALEQSLCEIQDHMSSDRAPQQLSYGFD